MGKVVAVRDAESFEKLRNELEEIGGKYVVLFDVGVGTGLPLNALLSMKVGDVASRNGLPTIAGGEFVFSDELKERIRSVADGRPADEHLFLGRAGSPSPLSNTASA